MLSDSLDQLPEDMKQKLANFRIPDYKFNFTIPTPPLSKTNPAKWMYNRLGEYIKHFESKLDENHEIGARLVSFGQTITFHIENVGYYGPDIISFYGINSNGERIQLIQHISQLSVLLVAVKKLENKAYRIGYIWDKDIEEPDEKPE